MADPFRDLRPSVISRVTSSTTFGMRNPALRPCRRFAQDRNLTQSLRKQIGAEHLAGMFASHGKTPDCRNGDGVGGVAAELAGRGGALDRAGREARQI